MAIVTVHQAKTQLSKLIAAAERGEEVVIARGARPVVRLAPVAETLDAPKPRRTPGRLKGIIAVDDRFFEPLPEEDLRLWEGEGRQP